MAVAPLAAPPKRRDQVKLLAPNAFKVEFTASDALQAKLKEAQALLRHRRPDGSLAFIVEEALDVLIAKVKKKRFGIGAKPRSAPARTADAASEAKSTSTKKKRRSSRHVSYGIRRVLAERDELRCTHVGPDGRRCSETAFLELDHTKGFARTRQHSVEDMRLLCKVHNALAAEQLYGRDFMKRKLEEARAAKALPLASEVEAGTRPGTGESPPQAPLASEAEAGTRPGTGEASERAPLASEGETRPGTGESPTDAPLASEAEGATRPGTEEGSTREQLARG